MTRHGLVLAVAVALAAATGAAPARAAAVAPTQALAALLRAHIAYPSPDPAAAPLGRLFASRPLTGERTTLPVLADATGADGLAWLRVRLPGRPNGRTGWINQRGTAAAETPWHVVVDTVRRRVVVYDRGRAARTFAAIVGKPSTPTPRGEFFVEETVRLRATDVGAPYALALSARSYVLQEFAGGPGQIALHGRSNVGGVLGSAVSHGCVRLDDAAMRWLAARLGPGVPVTITRATDSGPDSGAPAQRVAGGS